MNTSANTIRFARSALLGTLALMICAAASAGDTPSKAPKYPPGVEFKQRTVRYSDLDLTVQSDVVRLYRRIDRAAALVCGGRSDVLAIRSARFAKCRAQALADAIDHVNKPMLTAYYQERHKNSTTDIKTYASAK